MGISQLSGESGAALFYNVYYTKNLIAVNIFYTRKQNFRIKPHHFPKANSAEQYEAQTIILIGCQHSNCKNIKSFTKFLPSPSETAMEHSTDLKLSYNTTEGGKKMWKILLPWEELDSKKK